MLGGQHSWNTIQMQSSTPQGWQEVSDILLSAGPCWHNHNELMSPRGLCSGLHAPCGVCFLMADNDHMVNHVFILEEETFFLYYPCYSQIWAHECAVSQIPCSVNRLLPPGTPFITSVWMLAVVKIARVHVWHFECLSLSFSVFISYLSNPRVSIRPRHSFSRRGVCSDTLLCRGYVHHVRLWLPPQGSPWGGVEVGRLQWGRRVWGIGVQRVCRRQRKSSRRSLRNEPTQQRGWTHGKHGYTSWFLVLVIRSMWTPDCSIHT